MHAVDCVDVKNVTNAQRSTSIFTSRDRILHIANFKLPPVLPSRCTPPIVFMFGYDAVEEFNEVELCL